MVDGSADLHGPAGDTFTLRTHTILVVTRTLTSAYHVLDATRWFRDDLRIEFVFTVDESSAFGAGVRALLDDREVRRVSWAAVFSGAVDYHLVLSASENIAFEALRAPAILLMHGAGFNKSIDRGAGRPARQAGLPTPGAVRSGKVTIALAHDDQERTLLATNPEIAGHTAVVGDPTVDRLLASRAHQDRYRAALRTGERTLVVLASTWGSQSLIGRDPTLPARLLATLPSDEYQLALVLHPNVWARHGTSQLSIWLSSALEAGLVLLPPDGGWQPALVAADQVVTDHGSLALFAAVLDRPLLITGRATETIAGTPAADLADAADVLDIRGDLRDQLDRTRARHRPGRFSAVTDRAFTGSGEAADNLCRLIYEKLDLQAPEDGPPLSRFPAPLRNERRVTAHLVRCAVDADTVTLFRFPAEVRRRYGPDEPDEGCLVVDDAEPDLRLAERAAVLYRAVPGSEESEMLRWAKSALSVHPGARLVVAATTTGWIALGRNGTRVRISAESGAGNHTPIVAAAVSHHRVDGWVFPERSTVRAGSTVLALSYREFTASGSATR